MGKITDPVGFSIKHADAINADGASSCFLDSCESEASRDFLSPRDFEVEAASLAASFRGDLEDGVDPDEEEVDPRLACSERESSQAEK